MGDATDASQFPEQDPAHILNDKAAIQVPKLQIYESMGKGSFIRMLILFPGQRNDPLKGELELVEVNPSLSQSPLASASYEPLSYVWGPPPSPSDADHQVFISTRTGYGRLQLTASLYAALRRLRYADRERRLWVDQICINQGNVVERSQQVQFMNIIYKHASHVLVWLGQDEIGPDGKNVAESAFSLVRKLDEIFREKEKRDRFHAEYHTEPALDRQSRDQWVPLDHLTKVEWFKRGWIVQEIGTAAPATLFWGEAEMDWMVLHRVCEELTEYHHLRKRFDISTSDIKYVFQRFVEPPKDSYHANRFDFIYELHRARTLRVTDQRDRVFAMLGHYSVSGPNYKGILNGKLKDMRADYTKSRNKAYIDVAKRALTGDTSSLITLAAVQHMKLPLSEEYEEQQEAKHADTDNLPSWVPDWETYQSFILSEPINPHRAHGTTTSRLSFNDTKQILTIQGVRFDVVEACSNPLAAKSFHLESSSAAKQDLPITYLWHGICRQENRFNLDDLYPNGESRFFAYMQTLSNGCAQIATKVNRAYDKAFEDECLVKAAMHVEKVLGCDAMSTSLREMARKMKTKDEWSRAANGASTKRVFARTEKGYYVLGPTVMREGDVVVVLYGGKMPFVLRPWGRDFLLVGECYVHGLMKGEALDLQERKCLAREVFTIV